MKKLNLYIETSVWNFIFADDAPEKQAQTKEFFKEVKNGIHKIFISPLVISEIEKTHDLGKTNRLLAVITAVQNNPKTPFWDRLTH